MRAGPCGFTLRHLRTTLREARRRYRFRTFSESGRREAGKAPVIFLRHDVDHSLHDAHRLAALEADWGVRATYFVQLHCPLYSVMDGASRSLLRAMRRMGHELGFHYDLGYYRGPDRERARQFRRDLALFEDIAGARPLSVARHDPGAFRADEALSRAIRSSVPYDAYAPEFFREIRYLSDSSGRWRSGCFCNHVQGDRSLQLLIHPVYWVNPARGWRAKIRQSWRSQVESTTALVDGLIEYYGAVREGRQRRAPIP